MAAVPAGEAFSGAQAQAIERAIAQAHAESDLHYSVFVGAPTVTCASRDAGCSEPWATRRTDLWSSSSIPRTASSRS